MKKGIITGITILVVSIPIIVFTTPESVAQVSISDIQQKTEIKVKAPWGVLRSGAIYVFAEGEITGKGKLHIYSNHRRDHQVHSIENQSISLQINEPEAWVDDLQVEWEPIEAKEGRIEVFIGCGKGWDELQEWIHKNKSV